MKNKKTSQMDERLDMRIPSELLRRIAKQARRLNTNTSTYIRIRMTQAVERDEGGAGTSSTVTE